MEQQSGLQGKKIFFLFPHSVIREDMLDVLIMAGYETYTLVDEKKARKLLVKFPDSIMFINIDEHLKENEWEAYIKGLQEDPQTKSSRLGIMSYNQDRALMQKYLMDMAVPCGYIQLKLGIQASIKIMLDALRANEAKGRRQFIRATCADDPSATMNYKAAGGTIYYGKLLDVSSAGFAARLEKFGDFPPNSKLREVQLNLRGKLVLTDVILMGTRKGSKNEWIFLFDPHMQNSHKLEIHRFIKLSLQKYIDTLSFNA